MGVFLFFSFVFFLLTPLVLSLFFFSPSSLFSKNKKQKTKKQSNSYVAHWREQLSDPDLKIVRPQEVYEGVWLRDVEAVGARAGPDPALKGDDEFGKLPASNAYRRRVAGENWQ